MGVSAKVAGFAAEFGIDELIRILGFDLQMSN